MKGKEITTQYGAETLTDFLPGDRGNFQVIESPKVSSEIDSLPEDLIKRLESPLKSPPLKEIIQRHYPGSGKQVFVLTDDHTRPNRHTKILHPLILNYLREQCGVKKEDLRILVASGTHRPPTEEEIRGSILGTGLFEEFREQILIHNDRDHLAVLGISQRGTPITINKHAFNACLIIPVTDSEYHYFAGVAGTVKQLFPGIAGRKTTNTNHPKMFDQETGFISTCRLGNTAGNPVISDMKEMAAAVQDHVPVFCVDAILDQGDITYLNAGDILSLHQVAQEKLAARRVIHLDQPGDLVIVTVGNLGINLYQAGKGIHAAWNAAKKPGGEILLLAPCQDGVGSPGYQETMEAVQTMDLERAMAWVINNKCSVETFRIGNQKPIDTLRILKSLGEGKIKILSEMDPEVLRKVYRLEPLPKKSSPRESLRAYLEEFTRRQPDALIYVLNDAGLYITTG